ncbi:hypothetical protein MTR_1g040490, partial [Medicago truncatula]
ADRRRQVGQEICRYISPSSLPRREILYLTHSRDKKMNNFAEEFLGMVSSYVSPLDVNFFRSKMDISSTENEKDVTVSPCDVGERVCDQRLESVVDESFLMYMAVLEEFGVMIPFTDFETDVLKFLNVAPSQICHNIWAFIRGFEILYKALSLEPYVGVFFHFYGTKHVIKGTWVSISAHPGKKNSLPMLLTLRKTGGIPLLGCRGHLSA